MKIINIGYLLVTVGIIMLSSEFIIEKNNIIEEKNKIEYSLQKESIYLKKEIVDTYNIILNIPKLNLRKGIFDKSDKRNNIDENVTIHKISNYPNEQNSNVILMAHSGNGKKAFFKDINKLDSDSLIEIYYQRVKYVYKIDNYYEIDKNGIAAIRRDKNKKTITLITCNQQDKSKQLIYIGYLIDEINY